MRQTRTAQATLYEVFSDYEAPTLVLFRGQTPTACGTGQAAMVPFYCPGDRKVYLDMGLFDDMAQRFGAGGDFARTYVIAHEIGHCVQDLLGVSKQTQHLRQGLSEVEYNKVSGRAASTIGDDMLQKQARGVVVPDSFTHGSSAQRVRWFKAGFDNGSVKICDTFWARDL